jgi:hypothetical protein
MKTNWQHSKGIGKDYNIQFTDEQKSSFFTQPNIGMPANMLKKFLDLRMEEQDKILKEGRYSR